MCSSALATARSVPGSGCRCRSAWRARGGDPGVDDDQPAAAAALLGEPAHQRRHGLRRVRADQQQGVGPAQVGERERQPAVDAEGAHPGGRRRGHAEPSVVVDVPGAQPDPGELSQRVRLLVGQAAATEDGDRVPAGVLLDRADAGDDPVERGVPARRAQLAGGRVAQQGSGQPLRVVEQFGGGPTLLAEPAPVGGELAGVDRDPGVVLAQRHAALQCAVRAVRRHLPGRQPRSSCRPCTVCHVGKACRRAVSGPGLFCFGPVKWGSHRTRARQRTDGRQRSLPRRGSTADTAVPAPLRRSPLWLRVRWEVRAGAFGAESLTTSASFIGL